MVYRSYVADTLQLVGENTAKFVGGRYIKKRYIEIATGASKKEKQDDRSGQEIAGDVIGRLTLLKGGENENESV